jgi:hypothetical protein
VSLNDRGFKQLINILIMKNLSKLGKALNKAEQQLINGGARVRQLQALCLLPYLIQPEETCAAGYHLHPQGHCICCKN